MKEDCDISQGEGLYGGRLCCFNSLHSTNQWAMDNINSLEHGDVVWALRQTAGKGRFDRTWIAPEDRCLTLSVILKPSQSQDVLITTISQITALAVAETLEQHSISTMVKWPNDVMAGGRKIAGILAQRDDETEKIVLGIGLNVNMNENDFKVTGMIQPATSMKMETHRDYDVRQVLKTLLVELEKTISLVDKQPDSFPVEAWQKRDFLKDKRISVQTADSVISGDYSCMDNSGRLRLIDSSGQEHLLWSGDVSVSKHS